MQGGLFNGGGGGLPAGYIEPHVLNFQMSGDIIVPEGAGGDTFLPSFVHVPAGRTAKLVAVWAVVAGGTVTFSVRRNGVDVAGFTGLITTGAADFTDAADVTLAEGDYLAPLVTAVAGTPVDLTVALFLELT